jgi:hypothetical protein
MELESGTIAFLSNLEAAKVYTNFQGIGNLECTSTDTNYIVSNGGTKQGIHPKVDFFAEFSTCCGGWSVGSCPNQCLDFVSICASDFIENDNDGSIVNPSCGLECT